MLDSGIAMIASALTPSSEMRIKFPQNDLESSPNVRISEISSLFLAGNEFGPKSKRSFLYLFEKDEDGQQRTKITEYDFEPYLN